MGDRDLDGEFIHEIDDNDSDVDVSGVVPNVQEEPSVCCKLQNLLLSGK